MALNDWQDMRHALGSARVSSTQTAPDVRDRARRFVASQASDAAEAREILLMLGLIKEKP